MDHKNKKQGENGRRKGKIQIAILHLLSVEQMNGYQIMKKLEEKTDGHYSPSTGTIYPALQELDGKGFIELDEIDGRKEYRIKEDGLQFLQECDKNGEVFWSDWKARMIWKQSQEWKEIKDELHGWKKEMKKAEGFAAQNPADAGELVKIIADAKERLAHWNSKH